MNSESKHVYQEKEVEPTPRLIPCHICHGRGYIDINANDTKDCYACNGSGHIKSKEKK